jgi:hypothetical protein
MLHWPWSDLCCCCFIVNVSDLFGVWFSMREWNGGSRIYGKLNLQGSCSQMCFPGIWDHDFMWSVDVLGQKCYSLKYWRGGGAHSTVNLVMWWEVPSPKAPPLQEIFLEEPLLITCLILVTQKSCLCDYTSNSNIWNFLHVLPSGQ